MPRKNLREFRGKSLLLWAMHSGLRSKYIDQLLVSTEDKEIFSVALQCGVSVHARPQELATDIASCEDALRHALSLYPHAWAVLLQPTSPLRTTEDIDTCIERAQLGEGCISVGPEGFTNGAVYVAKADWIAKHDFNHLGLMKYRMPAERSLDIDEEKDFE